MTRSHTRIAEIDENITFYEEFIEIQKEPKAFPKLFLLTFHQIEIVHLWKIQSLEHEL